MKRRMLFLVVGIPASSVVMGIVMLVLAMTSGDSIVEPDERAMSKTSWEAAK